MLSFKVHIGGQFLIFTMRYTHKLHPWFPLFLTEGATELALVYMSAVSCVQVRRQDFIPVTVTKDADLYASHCRQEDYVPGRL